MAAKPGIARSDGTPGNFLIGKLTLITRAQTKRLASPDN